MKGFSFRAGKWYADGVPLEAVAEKVGTPAYVYSLPAFEDRFREIDRAYRSVPHLVAYSVKSNGCLSALRALRKLGSGADVVSGGELHRARRAGIPAERIIFAGVGKTREEIRDALRERIRFFNVESLAELEVLDEEAARLRTEAPVAVRFNPDVDPRTHRYITTGRKETKFGVAVSDMEKVCALVRRLQHVRWNGVHVHIGSQMTDPKPLARAARVVESLVMRLRREGFPITTVNFGGGYGIDYAGERPPKPSAWARAVLPVVRRLHATLIVEPGRFISGNSGVLLTRVVVVKQSGRKTFVVTDAGMGELIRPALYGAYHRIAPASGPQRPVVKTEVVGPICESGDFLAQGRPLPRVRAGDLLVVFSAGAYASVMGSTYNARPLAPEVVVRGRRFAVARRRQTVRDLMRGERFVLC